MYGYTENLNDLLNKVYYFNTVNAKQNEIYIYIYLCEERYRWIKSIQYKYSHLEQNKKITFP